MSSKKRVSKQSGNNRVPVPGPISGNEGQLLLCVCIPKSLDWLVTVKSAIYAMTSGWYWVSGSGDKKKAQEIALDIYEGIFVLCQDDLIEALNSIELAVSGVSLQVDLSGLESAISSLESKLDQFKDLFDATGNASALIESISDNVEAFRTTFETRSVAETTAQNTNFEDLNYYVEQLQFEQQNIQALLDAIENVLGGTFDLEGGNGGGN